MFKIERWLEKVLLEEAAITLRLRLKRNQTDEEHVRQYRKLVQRH